MENQELALGQRTGKMILVDSTWSQDELALLEKNGVTVKELAEHWVISNGEDTLNAAIGAVVMLKNGQGQERNMPFQTQEEADASVSGVSAPIENVGDLQSSTETKE